MSIRVNLLKPGEFRRQGAVSGAFAMQVSIFSVLAFAILFGLLAFMRHQTATREFEEMTEIWTVREPMYNRLQAMKQDLATIRKLQSELRGWNAARVEWRDPMIQLQMIFPATMQLRRLDIRGDLEIKLTQSGPLPGEEGEGAAPAPAQTGTPQRRYIIRLDGKATGSMAEDDVVRFVGDIQQASLYKPLIESIKLNSLQRDAGSTEDQVNRLFSIEATMKRREMKFVELKDSKEDKATP